jgi:hypothetical protein
VIFFLAGVVVGALSVVGFIVVGGTRSVGRIRREE